MSESRRIAEILEGAGHVLVTSHVPPDGDGFGAGIALVRWLRSRGAKAVFAAGGPIQQSLRFLAEEDEYDTTAEGPEGDFDVAVALDSGTLGRLKRAGERAAACEHFLNIDHHGTNDRYGTVNWVDERAPATGEMVYRLFGEMGVPLTQELAMPLYVALVTDTGRFGYSNTTPEAHAMAGALLETGIRPDEATNRLYRSVPLPYLRLSGLALTALEIGLDGLLVSLTVTEKMLADTGADPLDAGDLVDLLMSIEGVEVGALFRDNGEGRTKISFRSKRWFHVSRFAGRYGGGGHPRAAGAVIDGAPEEAAPAVIEAIEAELAGEARERGLLR